MSRPAQLAKNECGDECRVDAGDGSGLGRREHAAVNAAENDDRRAQRPHAAARGMQKVLEVERLAGAEILALGAPDDVSRDHDRDEQAGDHAGGVEPRNRFLSGRPIDDHRDAGRDHHVDRADSGDQTGGEGFRIAGLAHRRHHHLADGGDRCSAGAGNGAENSRGADRGDAQAAAHRSDAVLHEIDQALRDAAAPHQLARINEERHRQQRRGVDRPEQVLVHHDQRHVHEEHERDGDPGQQHHEDRKADQQQHDRYDEQRECHSHTLPSAGAAGSVRPRATSVARRQTAISKISANPRATKPCGIHIGTPAISLVRPIMSICRA